VTVKVVIGTGEKQMEIHVPKNRLCEVSEFFAAGCSDRWASGREGVIRLEEEDPKVFSIFLAWAFGGGVQNSEDYIIVDEKETDSEKHSSRNHHYQLVQCYILGEKLIAFEFKNAIIDLIIKSQRSIVRKFNTTPCSSPKGICMIYANTPAKSPLRRVLIHTLIAGEFKIRKKCLSSDTSATFQCYEEFFLDITACMSSQSHGVIYKMPWD
jgi:hypothetical protein